MSTVAIVLAVIGAALAAAFLLIIELEAIAEWRSQRRARKNVRSPFANDEEAGSK